MKQKDTREFLGTLVTAKNYRDILEKEGRDGLRFHAKHLKAYKRGDSHFAHGWHLNENGEKVRQKFHPVLQK